MKLVIFEKITKIHQILTAILQMSLPLVTIRSLQKVQFGRLDFDGFSTFSRYCEIEIRVCQAEDGACHRFWARKWSLWTHRMILVRWTLTIRPLKSLAEVSQKMMKIFQKMMKINENQWNSMKSIDFHWFSLIFIDFHWFSLNFHWNPLISGTGPYKKLQCVRSESDMRLATSDFFNRNHAFDHENAFANVRTKCWRS